MDIVDLLIHVEASLDATGRSALEEGLREVEGVIAPRFNGAQGHLLAVAYDPERVVARQLLRVVQAAGYRACLVGL